MRVLLAVTTLAVTASGCALLSGSQPDNEGQPQGPQLPAYLTGLRMVSDEATTLAVTSDTVMRLDPCALHDPHTAATVTGQVGDEIVPGSNITECILRTVDPKAPLDSSFAFRISVGEPYSPELEADAAPVILGGQRFSKSDLGEGHCTYDYDLGQGIGISLSASFQGSPNPQMEQQACQAGDRYLEATAQRYADPPLREQGKTQPTIRTFSPCTSIKKAIDLVPRTPGATVTEIAMLDPSTCSVEDRIPDPKDPAFTADRVTRVDVQLEFGDDPQRSAEKGLYPAITVAGRPGTQKPPDPSDRNPVCTVSLRMDDAAVVDSDLRTPGSRLVAPILKVQAPACEQAAAVAEATLREGLK